MSDFMEIHTSQPLEKVMTTFDSGSIGPFALTSPHQKTSTRWAGEWQGGDYSIRALDDDDRHRLKEQLGLPLTFQSRVWITVDELYEGQTDVYHMTAILLKEWPGDLVLLNGGDDLEVQRVNGQISLREDCLNPERLVFYQDFNWKPLPATGD